VTDWITSPGQAPEGKPLEP
jgi:NADPH:quinone reductase-like Zn-dependent oxidoreductase